MTARIGSAVLAIVLAVPPAAAQTPQPFPRPGGQKPAPVAPPASPTAPMPQVATAGSSAPSDVPAEATLGAPIFPNAQFIGSYDAGHGQRYYLFGTNMGFLEIVSYYKTVLKQKGEQVYEEPPIHEFDIGKFKEETMAFPPGVTVKDYTWGGSQGYLNPKRGAQPPRFRTIIQIVPAPTGVPQ